MVVYPRLCQSVSLLFWWLPFLLLLSLATFSGLLDLLLLNTFDMFFLVIYSFFRPPFKMFPFVSFSVTPMLWYFHILPRLFLFYLLVPILELAVICRAATDASVRLYCTLFFLILLNYCFSVMDGYFRDTPYNGPTRIQHCDIPLRHVF